MRPLVYLSLTMLSFTILSYGLMGATNAQIIDSSIPPLSIETELALYSPGSTVVISGLVKTLNENYDQPVLIRIVDPSNSIVTIQQVIVNSDGTYSFSVVAGGTWKTAGEYTIFVNYGAQKAEGTFEFTGGEGYTPPPPPDTTPPPPPDTTPPPPPKCGADQELVNGVCMDKEPVEPSCGTGTHLENGQCVPDQTGGGGCLIATAAFGSELAPQVQMLREIRDNTILGTTSGTAFMTGFNQFYYSFSPTIADWERENPIFQDAVRIIITPLLTSLSILNYVDIDSEEEMLGYGISLIVLNLGMYFVAPAIVILKLKKRF
ncbi:MAG: CFI-box-CTERM domain-containing protein [Nitrosopumilus sp.]